jgi:hypothetical protein
VMNLEKLMWYFGGPEDAALMNLDEIIW